MQEMFSIYEDDITSHTEGIYYEK